MSELECPHCGAEWRDEDGTWSQTDSGNPDEAECPECDGEIVVAVEHDPVFYVSAKPEPGEGDEAPGPASRVNDRTLCGHGIKKDQPCPECLAVERRYYEDRDRKGGRRDDA